MPTHDDLTGLRFGKLTVLHREPKTWSNRAFWRCLCDCGEVAIKMGKYLKCGDTKSCGCTQSAMRAAGNPKYGGAARRDHPREYTIWRSMKSRCLTPSSSNYRFYGGRGVTVCDRWRDDFMAFMADMGPCPGGLTLDRINPHGNYEPGNCRWVTHAENVRNR